jgi:probable DNA metabolism protein
MDRQGDLFAEDDYAGNPAFKSEDADKVEHEIHRMMGFLRFAPNEDGVYIARCAPDYFNLPVLGPHFKKRFGDTPWLIIVDKRRLCVRCLSGTLELLKIDTHSVPLKEPVGGKWEDLWRNYHKTINNENRNNPNLQRQFMPKRYWKYLTELDSTP